MTTSVSNSSNRLELLLFYVGDKRRFAINVLKIKEVIPCPALHQLPSANPKVLGVSEMRNVTLPIIDLAKAISSTQRTLTDEQIRQGSVITTEINRSHQGLWISGVDKIVLCDWKDILPPAKGTGIGSYTTGVTLIDDELVQLLDIEKVLAEVLNLKSSHTEELNIDQSKLEAVFGKLIMIVDDSSMAMKQTVSALDKLGLQHISASDGKVALKILTDYPNGDPHTMEPISMIISDIEMPEMNGYTFVTEARKLSKFKNIHVLMHTSLNGSINMQEAIACGANDVLTKFVPDELVEKIVEHLMASPDS
ncbi:MAG: chemotaxis protein [gamma proteobacterium symbiont of Lucinoma myriamae]|nr:chemotaxis protein [gamma proteobacterium symbiont of Lucinoma myriamae]MCU7819590.1 chemotaxis protein [gamma proteobacterium symbiont of Lucinoma myriamae]MCU7832559.1 chemotaxis protein [gamma proteobacterium symbiont of Lucinoma myriamae]